MKNRIIYFCCLLFIQYGFAQYTQVPDPNFEQALIDLGIDSEGTLDGQFLTADAIGVLDLFIDNRSISDLTGIEAFVDLFQLFAFDNQITSIDLSLLPPDMWTINLGGNNLTTIDFTPINIIINLGLHSNNFTEIDVSNISNLAVLSVSNQNINNLNLTNCIDLQVLDFSNTSLQNIDLSDCSSLRNVYCDGSQIQTLDFTNNQNLEWLEASNTPLTTVNLPDNPDLEYLFITGTPLTELDITNCPSLWYLNCSNNFLTSLDLSGNTLLEELRCPNNQLSNLNISQNISLLYVNIGGNQLPNLDVSNNVSLEFLGLTNNPLLNLTGISSCINLEDIRCDETLLTDIDLSQNPNLEIVDFFQCPSLEFVNMRNGANNDLLLFIGTQCPQLSCVVVDDPNAGNENILVDPNTILVGSEEECNLALNDNDLQNLVSMYPNPVEDILFIENNNNIEFEKITVFDILGKMILLETYNFDKLNLSNIKSGVLFVKIRAKNGTITKKIIKI